MNIASSIVSSDEAESDLALDFSSFLLRYNRDLDYQDFSDDLNIQNKIKRAETFRSWADIEDLAHGFENLSSNFESHRTTAANAFNELYQYIEKTKQELKGVGGDMSILRRLELLEQRSNINHAQSQPSNYIGDMAPKIIKDNMTNQIKLEDTLLDYMEIIISLNAKLNSHVNTTKLSIREMEEKYNDNGIPGTYFENGGNKGSAPKGDILKIQQRYLELETELEKLKLDVLSQK